jgi:uncharacterized membrane protein
MAQRQNRESMMMKVAQQISFSGPLPPPEALERYNQVLPGAADRILKMAEQQSQHRQGLERTVVESNAYSQKLGVWLGFIIAMTAVVGGIVLILHGRDGYGLAAIVTALASLAGVFIYGKSKQKRELDQKAEDFVRPPQVGVVKS